VARDPPEVGTDDPFRPLFALPRPPSGLEPNFRYERCSGQESCDRSPRHSVRFDFQAKWVPLAKAAAEVITQGDATHTVVAHLTDPGTTGGTIAYMSPEQTRGQTNLAAPSDRFLLGLVLYGGQARVSALQHG